MPSAESFRLLVSARAGGACEYCRLLEAATGVTFHVEHVRPTSQGGSTTLANLALSCPGCNLSKADRLFVVDESGNMQPLYNPRSYDPWILGWHLNFILDRESGLILPRTPIGEATIAALTMNRPNRVFARRLQISAGLIG